MDEKKVLDLVRAYREAAVRYKDAFVAHDVASDIAARAESTKSIAESEMDAAKKAVINYINQGVQNQE